MIRINVHDREAQYEAARLLLAFGPRYVLVKGGHLREDVYSCVGLCTTGIPSANCLAPGSTPTTLTVLQSASD